MALYAYHYEIYASKIGNKWYVTKLLGSPVDPSEKCIFGVLITSIVLILLVGPVLLFSDMIPGLVVPNPIHDADVKIYLHGNQTIYSNSSTQEILDRKTLLEGNFTEVLEYIDDGSILVTNRSVPNLIYENAVPFIMTYNEPMW